MEEVREWKVVNNNKGKRSKNKNIKNIIIEDEPENSSKSVTHKDEKQNDIPEKTDVPVDLGEHIKFPVTYVIWCHDVFNKNWNIDSYVKLCEISNASSFWRLFNNLGKIGYRINNFFFMKEDIEPTWEHKLNRNGGICSFKTDIDHALDLFEMLCLRMICNELTDIEDDINGISFSPKNNSAIIKIWNKDRVNDLSQTLNQDILDYCKDMSIKYKANNPEY